MGGGPPLPSPTQGRSGALPAPSLGSLEVKGLPSLLGWGWAKACQVAVCGGGSLPGLQPLPLSLFPLSSTRGWKSQNISSVLSHPGLTEILCLEGPPFRLLHVPGPVQLRCLCKQNRRRSPPHRVYSPSQRRTDTE